MTIDNNFKTIQIMTDLDKLGKITEIIGKLLFSLLVLVVVVLTFAMHLEKNNNTTLLEKITVVAGAILANVIFYFILKALFKPIYNLNRYIQLRVADQLTIKQYNRKWIISLICTVIISLLPVIPTFGISILLMIPQFILLFKSKRI